MMSRSRRRRNDPPKLELTRVRGLGIAGRDATGYWWQGIDAIKTNLTCDRCGDRFQYGYMRRHYGDLAHCVNCVVFVDAQERSGR